MYVHRHMHVYKCDMKLENRLFGWRKESGREREETREGSSQSEYYQDTVIEM